MTKKIRLGNGARAAVRAFFLETGLAGDRECVTDVLLADLWVRGFKIVPLTPEDEATPLRVVPPPEAEEDR